MRTLILGLIFFLISQVSFSKGKPIFLYKGIDSYEIGSYVDILEDKSNKFTLKDIQNPQNENLFNQNKSKTIKFGPSTSTYWLRIKTQNKGASSLWYLWFNTSKIDHLTIYRKPGDESTTGLKYSIKSREVMSRYFVFKMDVGSVSTFYVKVKNDEIKLPFVNLKMIGPSEFKRKDTLSEVGNTLFLGILFAMFLYNILIVVETKSLTDISYTGWLFFFTLAASYRTGLGQLYFFPDGFFFRTNVVYFLSLCHMSLFSLFAYRFLNIIKFAPKFKWFFIYWGIGFLIPVIFGLFSRKGIFFIFTLHIVVSSFGFLSVLIYLTKKKVRQAQVFLQAGSILALPIFIYGLLEVDIIPNNFFTRNIVLFGIIGFVMALSKILVNRFRRIQIALIKKEHEAKQFEKEADKKLKDEVRKVRLIMSEQTRTLKTQNKLLTDLDSKKTEFFQNISHELRTPLTLILNPLEKLLGKDENNEQLLIANRNAQRLYRLVNQLLDFQKITSGEEEIVYHKVDLLKFIHKCYEAFKPNCKSKKIKFNFMFNDNKVNKSLLNYEKLFIRGDLDSLERIIYNLLSNAFLNTPEGSSITIHCQIEHNIKIGKVRVSVVDEGVGISEDQKRLLSKLFSKDSNGQGVAGGGKGLGLPLVKELAERLDGEVNFQSEEGEGSNFWVEFPIYNYNTLDCLAIDDEEDICIIYQDFFEKFDLVDSFKVVQSADEARTLMEKFSFKVILCDASMPGESGIEFLKWVSEASPKTGRFLVTGKSDGNTLQEAVNKAKVHEVIFKPWSVENLFKKMEKLLRKEEIANIEKHVLSDWDIEDDQSDEEQEVIVDDLIDSFTERVLIVDDLGDMRKMMAGALKSSNFQTITAKNGKDGLEKALKYKPDLIITDWMMPVMTGPDLIRKLRELDEFVSTPIVLLTAKSDEESKIIGSEIGADGFLGKPFNEHELVSVVGNLISLKSKEKEVINLNKHITENVLKRYLPPALVDDIVAGKVSLNQDPKAITGTILFADLCQFTRNTARLRSVKMSRVLNEYLSFMNDIIYKHQGTIDKFIGDAIMVIFGAPVEIVPQEQAKRAIACSLEMQDRMSELNDKWGQENIPEIEMRIGLHFGPLVVGNFGGEKRSDYTAIGSTVNLASRIETACDPGEIFMSGEICDFLGEDDFEEAGSFSLKGVEGKTYLYRLKKAS